MVHKTLETISLATELIVSGLLLAGAVFLWLSLWSSEVGWGVTPSLEDYTPVILMLINGIGGLLAGIIAMRRWQAHALAVIVGIVVIVVGYTINQAQFFIGIYISFNLIIGGFLGLIGAEKVKAPPKVAQKAVKSQGVVSSPEVTTTIGNSLRLSRPVTPGDIVHSQPDGLSPLRLSSPTIQTSQEKKCPKCGGMLPTDARFCNTCGFRF